MTRDCLPPRPLAAPPAFTLPAGACDAHAHVFGPYDRYPLDEDRSYTPPPSPLAAYIAHLDELGFERGVLVTASACGTDNRSVLDALRAHPERLRAVVVPPSQISDRELDDWTAAGVRGVRINLFRRDGHAVYRNGVGIEALEAIAPRIAARGWHAQIWIHAPDLPELAPRLLKLKLPLVVDHMGRMSTAQGVAQPGFQQLCRMLADGTAWTKISGADRLTEAGPPYRDVDPFAAALIEANDERIVWGSDWPHINYFDAAHVPDDGALADLLLRWLPDERRRQRVLADNAAALYGF